MRFLGRLRRRHEELDARVASATARAETAGEEAAKSRARQEDARERVMEPLQQAARHDQFAEMITASLAEGHGKRS
jgi:hypothetical protein